MDVNDLLTCEKIATLSDEDVLRLRFRIAVARLELRRECERRSLSDERYNAIITEELAALPEEMQKAWPLLAAHLELADQRGTASYQEETWRRSVDLHTLADLEVKVIMGGASDEEQQEYERLLEGKPTNEELMGEQRPFLDAAYHLSR